MRTSAMVTAIVAVSTGFGVLVAQDQIAVRFAEWLAASVSERWIALAGLNIAFFLLAAVMDELAIMVIFGPLLIAIADGFGVDPVHFGAIIVTNVAVGDRKSTRLNSSHYCASRMPYAAWKKKKNQTPKYYYEHDPK